MRKVDDLETVGFDLESEWLDVRSIFPDERKWLMRDRRDRWGGDPGGTIGYDVGVVVVPLVDCLFLKGDKAFGLWLGQVDDPAVPGNGARMKVEVEPSGVLDCVVGRH